MRHNTVIWAYVKIQRTASFFQTFTSEHAATRFCGETANMEHQNYCVFQFPFFTCISCTLLSHSCMGSYKNNTEECQQNVDESLGSVCRLGVDLFEIVSQEIFTKLIQLMSLLAKFRDEETFALLLRYPHNALCNRVWKRGSIPLEMHANVWDQQNSEG